MFYVSEPMSEAPASFKSSVQQRVYETLAALNISFKRVDTDEAITMEDCTAINGVLHMEMVKTLFLCNRQQTDFYLFVTKGEKSFKSKDFSHALSIARVSFAPVELMEQMLGTPLGAATALSVVADTDKRIKVVFDSEVAAMPDYGCSDGTTTGYMKIATTEVLNKYLPFCHHCAEIITV